MKKLIIVSEIDSTSAELLRRLPLPHGSGIMARRQTQGRGRQGRAWQSLKGDLAASFWLVELGQPIPALPLVACLAVMDALRALSCREGFALKRGRNEPVLGCKWPNDIRVYGRKLAGILAAYQHEQRGVILGIGVNLAGGQADFAGLGRPATSVYGETGHSVPPEALFCGLALHLARRLRQWRREGFAPLRKEWLARCDHLGKTVRVHCPGGGIVEGVTKGLGPNGELLLDCNGQTRILLCGDVEA